MLYKSVLYSSQIKSQGVSKFPDLSSGGIAGKV